MSTQNIGLTKVIHPVRDLASAKAVYAALLGVEPTMDESYYVGYWQVADIEKAATSLTDADGNPIGLIQLPG